MSHPHPDRSSRPLRFIVIQLGARMHYAIPAILAKAGMLERFYTDICGNAGWTGFFRRLIPGSLRSKTMIRLFGRILPPEISAEKVRTCELGALLAAVLKKFRFIMPFAGSVDVERAVLNRVLKEGFPKATALYTNCINSDIEVVRAARARGLRIVHEVMINADVGRILHEERLLYPGIEPQEPQKEVEEGIQKDILKWSLSDLILVPSDFVLESTVRLGAAPEKIAVVPYGIDENWFAYKPAPRKGRVLFVGSVGLRKGSHYLAQAARILRDRGVPCDIRVVGPYDAEVIKRPEFRGPTYAGQCPRSRITEEYLSADVFVLPTLSEGSALVHLEAMACGIPVITTPNCGSMVRDGVEGFIVPIRDAEALSNRIAQLLADNSLRASMSSSARQRAREYTWDAYSERLLKAMNKLTVREV